MRSYRVLDLPSGGGVMLILARVTIAAALALTLALILSIVVARAQVAPGWRAVGEWQCGPYVRIITSSDGRARDVFLKRSPRFD
jgi:hypothetical protein